MTATLLRGSVTIVGLTAAVFVLMRLVPGGPFDQARPLAPAAREAIRARYGLDAPLATQVRAFVGGLLRGDLGPSIAYRDFAVGDLIASAWPVSAALGLGAVALAVPMGLGLALAASVLRAPAARTCADALVLTLVAMPAFLLAPLLSLGFGVLWPILPAGGWQGGAPAALVLPWLSLALPLAAGLALVATEAMRAEMARDHVRTARAAGRSRTGALLASWRAIAIPTLAWTAPAAGALVTGAVVAEAAFDLPGLGQLMIRAAEARDYPLVTGIVLLTSCVVVALNAAADLAARLLDPRP